MYIAIIIPVYNVEKFLERCLDSILNQTFKDYSLICVNDGSTDSCRLILNNYVKQHSKKIIVLNKKNGGLSSARNLGLDYALSNKEFTNILFIDSDDWLDKDFLDNIAKLYKKTKSDIIASSFYFSSADKNKEFSSSLITNLYTSFDATKLLLQDRTVQSHAWAKLYKKELWENVRFPEEIKFMEDQPTTYKLFLKSNTIYITNYAGYHYWQEGSSICRSKMTNKKVIDSLRGYIEAVKDPNLPKECFWSAIQGYVNCFLMMFPRFNKKESTLEERKQFNELVKYTDKHLLVIKFKPINKKEWIKKYCYIFFKPFYRKLFRLIAKD